MKINKTLLGILAVLLIFTSCKKDDDSSFEEIMEPINEIVGSLWMSSGNTFTELDLKNTQEINALTTLDSFRCNEFDGIFICTEGGLSDTKRLMRKGTFNGELVWSKEYEKSTENYYRLNKTEIHQNTVLLSYNIIHTTTTPPFNIFNITYHIESLDLDTGNVNWSIELANEVKRITIYKNQLIAELSYGSSTKELLSINIANGHIDHRIPFTDRIGQLISGTSSIFVMTWNNSVVSFDENLNENWSFSTESPNILGGYESGNQFIFYSRDRSIYSIDKDNGNLIWKNTYMAAYPLAIKTENDKAYIAHKKEGESNIQIKTLNLFSGEEIGSYAYTTNEELNPSSTKYYFFDQHLLIFNIVPEDNKANIALINISDKILVWEKELGQVAYPHLIITPTGCYQ